MTPEASASPGAPTNFYQRLIVFFSPFFLSNQMLTSSAGVHYARKHGKITG